MYPILKKGFTLIEVLISIALFAVLMLGLIRIWFGGMETAAISGNLSQSLSKAQAAMGQLEDDLRMASLSGSMTNSAFTPSANGGIIIVVNGVPITWEISGGYLKRIRNGSTKNVCKAEAFTASLLPARKRATLSIQAKVGNEVSTINSSVFMRLP